MSIKKIISLLLCISIFVGIIPLEVFANENIERDKIIENKAENTYSLGEIDGYLAGNIAPSTIRDVHKLLRSAFQQAVKWELMEKNPAINANTPKWKKQEKQNGSCFENTKNREQCEKGISS